MAPGDTRGTLLIPEKGDGYCCAVAASDGPNMACQACGRPVASRIDDCSLWQAVWLAPDAVRRRRVGGADAVPRSPRLFRADPGVLRHTLVRLPAVRSPWLGEILENIPQYVRAGLLSPLSLQGRRGHRIGCDFAAGEVRSKSGADPQR